MPRHVLLLALGLTLLGCGDAPRATTEPRVSLKLEAPSDGFAVRAERVSVHGTVTPGDSAVHVAGESVDVTGGAFTIQVELQPGGNVIDVTATAPGRRPATDALRVERDMRVEVPALVGDEYDAAVTALRKLGLRATEERGDSWLDRLLPGPVGVCATRPAAGTLVQRRATITLETARDC